MAPRKKQIQAPPALDASAMEGLRPFAERAVWSLVPLFESNDWECCESDEFRDKLVDQLVRLYPTVVRRKKPPPVRVATDESQRSLRSFYGDGQAVEVEEGLDGPRGAKFDERTGLLKIWTSKAHAIPASRGSAAPAPAVAELVRAVDGRLGTRGTLNPERVQKFLADADLGRAGVLWIVADRVQRTLKITDEQTVARQRCSVALSIWLPAIHALDPTTEWKFRCQNQTPTDPSCLVLTDGCRWIVGLASAPDQRPPLGGTPTRV